MPAKKDAKSKIVPKKSPPEEKKTNISLVVLSFLFLITLAGIVYLYLNLKNLDQKPIFIPKPRSTTEISPEEETGKTYQEPSGDLKFYKNEKEGFSLKYPASWGEVSQEEVAGRETFKIGPDSGFTLVVGAHFDLQSGEALSAEDLAESSMKSGCQRSGITVNSFRGTRLSCERTKNSSEQIYIQKGETIYILFYKYDATQIDPEKARGVFDSVFDSFKLL